MATLLPHNATVRCYHRVLGGHVHCRIFGPGSGKAGDLVFRVEEWEWVTETQPWSFLAEGVGADETDEWKPSVINPSWPDNPVVDRMNRIMAEGVIPEAEQ